MRGTLKDIEVGCRGGEQARRYQAGSLKPLQDLYKIHEALWTRLRSAFFNPPSHVPPPHRLIVVFLRPISRHGSPQTDQREFIPV